MTRFDEAAFRALAARRLHREAPAFHSFSDDDLNPTARMIPDNEDPKPAAVLVPLAFLMDPAHHERHSRDWQGHTRYYYAMPWQGRYIWGATAGMIRNLYRLMYEPK